VVNFEIKNKDFVSSVVFEGRVDNEGVFFFEEALEELLNISTGKYLFDLTEVSFINSLGIGKLLLFYKKVQSRNKELVIAGINKDLLALFRALKLDKLLTIAPDALKEPTV